MKKYIASLVIVVAAFYNNSYGQKVTISNNTPSQDPSAILDIQSTDKGLLLPRMTSNERNAIANPAKGLLVFQTTGTEGFYYYDGSAWLSLTGNTIVNNDGHSVNYGLTTVFAGSTYGTADGLGTAAKFKSPVGITIDVLGNLYLTDTGSHTIRKITPNGVVTLVAGSSQGYADNNSAILAAFNSPTSVAADNHGNLFIADYLNNRIRKIDAAGVVTTFAGDGAFHFADGVGTAAGFENPMGIAIDDAGNIYVADTYNNRIRKITPAAVVTTIAGNNLGAFINGTGTAASFSRPTGLTLDAAGNIYVTEWDNHCIRKITPAGVVTTFAGTDTPGYNDGPAMTALFRSPRAITMDKAGNFYVADAGNHAIRMITPAGMVSTLAGTGSQGFSDGVGNSVYFNSPSGVITDNKGNLFVTDCSNHLVRKIVIR